MITIGTVLENFSYVAISAAVIGVMVLFSYMHKKTGKTMYDGIYMLILIITGFAVMIPIIWLLGFVASETTDAVTDMELFGVYIPLFIVALTSLYAILILDNILSKGDKLL